MTSAPPPPEPSQPTYFPPPPTHFPPPSPSPYQPPTPSYQAPLSYPPPPSYPGFAGYPPAGYPPQVPAPPPPRELHAVVVLLIVNLALSISLTLLVVAFRHDVVNYQLDHRHITDPTQRALLRDSYLSALVGRVVGNIVVSVVYAFLVRALLRGRRWAYRRVIWIGCAGAVGLLVLQVTPYPAWMHAEQLVQAAVLAGLVYCVLRPEVRAYFAPHLPGRSVRRFGGSSRR